MIKYTTRYINSISLIITIPICIFINKYNNLLFISNIFEKSTMHVGIYASSINQETKEVPEKNIQENNTNIDNINNNLKKTNWKILIPVISLEAEISEGTDTEVMNKFIGHFEESSKTSGNIGLAAHNRGYTVNYFANIKKLKIDDEIIYKYYDFEKSYKVCKNYIIKDTDWTWLEKTEEKDMITLITCVENEPEYRRCVQAIEKE